MFSCLAKEEHAVASTHIEMVLWIRDVAGVGGASLGSVLGHK